MTPIRPSDFPAAPGAPGLFRPEALRQQQQPPPLDETLLAVPGWVDPVTVVLLLAWLGAVAASYLAPSSVPGTLLRLLLP